MSFHLTSQGWVFLRCIAYFQHPMLGSDGDAYLGTVTMQLWTDGTMYRWAYAEGDFDDYGDPTDDHAFAWTEGLEEAARLQTLIL